MILSEMHGAFGDILLTIIIIENVFFERFSSSPVTT